MQKFKASSLPAVIVISVLVLILILISFQLWNMNAFYYARYHFIKQQKFNLSSAITLYCNDSLFDNRLDNEGKFQLYNEDPHSVVYLNHHYWGAYECVNAQIFDQSISSVRFLGKVQDTFRSLALWLCDRDISLSLSGEAELSGRLFLPKNGVLYTSLHSDDYRGKIIPATYIHESEEKLPPVDSTFVKRMAIYMKLPSSFSDTIPSHYYSFLNDPICAYISDRNEGLYAKGKLILYGDKIVIPSSCQLSDILLVARHVTIESGFSGSIQILATDTVLIEKGVYLHYPSGVYLNGNDNKTYLHILQDAHVEGYAIVNGNAEGGNGFLVDIHYRQEKGSQLLGLLYVDGIAHLEGSISGSAYLKHCYYLSGESMYSGLIYNGKIRRNNNVAFPFLFKESGYKRKEIKRVD